MNDTIDNETGEVTNFEPMEVSGAIAAEISQQVATAKRYPRRSDKAISTEIMSRATLDEETAAECCYSLPRAGKDIVGPSVRFAELVFASYGNLRVGARFVELDTKDPARSAIIVEGVCIDMQMNNGQTVPVRRSITGKKGVFNADMTNIAFSAGAAIARREAIIKTVPKSIWGAAWKAVLAVLQGDQKTLVARRKSSLEAFQKMGVDSARVFAALDVAGEETITLEHMPRLIGMWTSLRDGTETIESLFGRGGSTHETVQNPLKDDPKPAGGAETTSKASESAESTNKQAASAVAPKKDDPISSGAGPSARAIASATTLIDKDGTVVRSQHGDIEPVIIDQRFPPAKQVFMSAEAWSAATDVMPEPEFQDQQDDNGSETASSEVENLKQADKASETATGVASPAKGSDGSAKTETAQASPAKAAKADQKPYEDAAGYMTHMQGIIDAATSKGAVIEAWGATRADRNALLSPEQIDELTADKEAKLKAFKLADGK